MAGDRGDGRPFEVQGYTEVSEIGRGASSHVYRGFDPKLARWVAIKVLLTEDPEDPARKRFKREGEITANLGKHPHIVQVFDTGFTISGYPYVAMEYFEQGSIGDRLRTTGTYTVAETLDIGQKIADAVAAAHRAQVLHRDIKPQNILVSEFGPALADFGIARSTVNLEWSQSLEQLTPMHAAPEVLVGGPSSRQSDIYSLGSTLYTMLAGRPPFAGPPGEPPLRYQVRVTQDPVPPVARTDVPLALTDALERALAKDPAQRFSTAEEFRDALADCARQIHASPTIAPWGPGALSSPSPRTPDGDDDTRTRQRAGPGLVLTSADLAGLGPGEHERPGPDGAEDESATVARPDWISDPSLGGVEPARSNRRWLVIGAAVVVGAALVVVGVVAMVSKSPGTVAGKETKKTPITYAIAAPSDVHVLPSATGAQVSWSYPTSSNDHFVVYQVTSKTTKGKPVGITSAGTTKLDVKGTVPSTTTDCFLVFVYKSVTRYGAPSKEECLPKS